MRHLLEWETLWPVLTVLAVWLLISVITYIRAQYNWRHSHPIAHPDPEPEPDPNPNTFAPYALITLVHQTPNRIVFEERVDPDHDPASLREEDDGYTKIITLYSPDDASEHLAVSLKSWDSTGKHAALDHFLGEKIRVTIEVVKPTPSLNGHARKHHSPL